MRDPKSYDHLKGKLKTVTVTPSFHGWTRQKMVSSQSSTTWIQKKTMTDLLSLYGLDNPERRTKNDRDVKTTTFGWTTTTQPHPTPLYPDRRFRRPDGQRTRYRVSVVRKEPEERREETRERGRVIRIRIRIKTRIKV